MTTMRAAVFDGQGGIAVREVPRPVLGGDYDILCRLVWGTTCTGTDRHIQRGRFPYGSGYPTIAGHESVGRVEALGAKVRHFRIGDLVTRVGAPTLPRLQSTWGGYAEWGLGRDHWAMAADGQPEAEWHGWRWNQVVPTGVDPRVAPLFITWRETMSFMKRLGMRAGWRVLILGGGGNGLAFAAMASDLGAGAVAMAGSPRSTAAAGRAGVTHFVDYHEEDLATALRASGPYEVLIDAVGKAGQLDRVLSLAAPDARVAIYGIDDLGQVTLHPTLAPNGFRFYPGAYDESETHQDIGDRVRAGRLEPSPWYDIDHPWTLEELPRAFEALAARQSAKALIRLE